MQQKKGGNTHYIFIICCLSYLLGIWIYNITQQIWLSIIIVAWIAAFLCCYKSKLPYVIYYSFYILFSAIVWIHISETAGQNNTYKEKYIQHISKEKDFIYQIKEVYNIWEHQKKYIVQLHTTSIYGVITVPYNFNLQNGDIISSTDKIGSITNFDPDFNYKKYMQSKNIYFTSYISSLENIGHTSPRYITRVLQKTRSSLLNNINELYPKEEAIFLWGILLWARKIYQKD